ncbi:hypothetical protein EF405_13720 [Cyclobacteriaceae bacterium YHN15]|nr:hypothetical protein EF405_13720 [Cyclobacteriaceae bacterium YHN15]
MKKSRFFHFRIKFGGCFLNILANNAYLSQIQKFFPFKNSQKSKRFKANHKGILIFNIFQRKLTPLWLGPLFY